MLREVQTRWGWVGVWVCWLAVVGCGSEQIAENLTERQANALVALMESHQIPAQRELDDQQRGRDRRWRLVVPAQEGPSARAVLTAYGLPQHDLEVALPEATQSQWPPQLFPAEGQSHVQQRELKQDLERTLSEFPGVMFARVHLNLSSVQPSAAVLLRTGVLEDVEREQLAEQVRGLLVGAAQPLRAEHVQISVHPPTLEHGVVPLARLGPWLVARGSLGGLRWALVGLTAGAMVLGGALLWVLRKNRQLQHLVNTIDLTTDGASLAERQLGFEGDEGGDLLPIGAEVGAEGDQADSLEEQGVEERHRLEEVVVEGLDEALSVVEDGAMGVDGGESGGEPVDLEEHVRG